MSSGLSLREDCFDVNNLNSVFGKSRAFMVSSLDFHW